MVWTCFALSVGKMKLTGGGIVWVESHVDQVSSKIISKIHYYHFDFFLKNIWHISEESEVKSDPKSKAQKVLPSPGKAESNGK